MNYQPNGSNYHDHLCRCPGCKGDEPIMSTYELPIYQQTTNGITRIYCEECKPIGSPKRGILVVSAYDHFCFSCGRDFKELAEAKEEGKAVQA